MTNCIFCQIIAGDIPACKVYEDEKVLAFLDITQVTKGHTLIIPKDHCRNLLDMPTETASYLFGLVPKLSKALLTSTGATGINLLNNSEEIAGQTVFHAHIHLIPRYQKNDGLTINFQTNDPDFTQLNQLSEEIAKETSQ